MYPPELLLIIVDMLNQWREHRCTFYLDTESFCACSKFRDKLGCSAGSVACQSWLSSAPFTDID